MTLLNWGAIAVAIISLIVSLWRYNTTDQRIFGEILQHLREIDRRLDRIERHLFNHPVSGEQ